MVEGLDCVNVVDARMHSDKLLVVYCVMIGYEIINSSIQET
jgi:hypothetical protein